MPLRGMTNKIFMRYIGKRLLGCLLVAASLGLAVSCLDEGGKYEGAELEVTFMPRLDDGLETGPGVRTRSVGDASKVDQLRTAVYLQSATGLQLKEMRCSPWEEVRKDGVSLKLNSEETYRILFWAEDKENTSYTFGEDGTVRADYTDYLTGGFAKMEELDAFFTTAAVGPGLEHERNSKVVLRRPLAQLNFHDTAKPDPGLHKAEVTFHSVPVAFNPFTGEVTSTKAGDSSDDFTFVFTDFPSEPLLVGGQSYEYLACSYILAATDGSTPIECSFKLTRTGQEIASHEFRGENALQLHQRRRTNVSASGDPDTEPDAEQWSEWNGKFPIVSTITTDPDDPDCYIIDAAEDIAWLGNPENTQRLEEGKTIRLVTNIDMGYKPGQKAVRLPAGSRFEGGGHTIKGLKLMIGLFGDNATDLDVSDLIIDGAIVSGTTRSHRGILVNTLYGSSVMNNIWIVNSSVSTPDGAAGGVIGYVSRKEKERRSEHLEVVFDNCHVINTEIQGSTHEGYFVGIFRGYDYGEILRFRNTCSCIPYPDAEPLQSNYVEGMESIWLKDNDYSPYNAWLGAEDCYRGTILYEDLRYIPKWDGKTKVKALLADPQYDDTADHKVTAGPKRYVIYSAYDLAGIAKKAGSTPYAMYFMADVDLNGQGKDGICKVDPEFEFSATESDDDNYFDSISYVDTLEGNNHTVYNLNLRTESNNGTAFIESNRKKAVTIHRNLSLRNCQTCVKAHDYVDPAGKLQDVSHGSIFMFSTHISDNSSYRMENIHVYDSRVYALQGIGILAHIFAGDMHNCTVNDCYIENFRCERNLEPFEHSATIGSGKINVKSAFYSYGEVGSLIGIMMGGGDSNVTDCHVKGTRIRAYGQKDRNAELTGEGLLSEIAVSTANAMGYFLIPGRHVSTLIGDVRAKNGETIRISGCTVDSGTTCSPHQDRHSNAVPFIGQAYYIKYMDTEGKVIVDGKTLTLADCNRNTVRQ